MVDDNDSPSIPSQGSVEETTAMLPSGVALSPAQPLIFDVLVQIMGLLDSRPDVLSFMKTSKALYQAGFPCLLRLPISLYLWHRSNNGHLQSFLTYLQKYPSRLQYIENFSAMMGGLGYQMIAQYYSNLFVAMMGVIKLLLRNAGSLRKLSFNGFGRHVDQEHSSAYPVSVVEVYPTQFTLNHLRDLFITWVGIDEILMLKGLTAPITSLMLIYADIFKATPDTHESGLNPFLLLTNFQSTIENLELTGCRWPGPNRQASPAHQGSSSFSSPPPYGICCPRLHTLTTSYETTPNTSSFVLAFPNLRRLTVLDDKEIFEGDYSGRESNTENQRALFRQGFGWDVLEKVTGHPRLLNALALQTKIHHLRVEYCYAQDLVLLHRLIQDTKPDILTLVLVDFQSTDPFRLDTHPRNLRIASPPYQLESLLLDVVEENDSLTSEEASEIAERTIRILDGISTKYLHVSIRWRPPRNATNPNNAKQYFESRRESIMSMLLHKVPSLERISISTGHIRQDPRWEDMISWKINTRTTESGSHVKMHEQLSEAQFEEDFERRFHCDSFKICIREMFSDVAFDLYD